MIKYISPKSIVIYIAFIIAVTFYYVLYVLYVMITFSKPIEFWEDFIRGSYRRPTPLSTLKYWLN